MNFSNLLSTKWLNDYNKWLPYVQWAGWLVVVALMAKVFWIWVLYFTAPSDFKPLQVNARPTVSNQQGVDVSGLLSKNLFGDVVKVVEKAPEVVTEKAPETRLNLKLRGIYAADTREKANAIIEDNRGQQAVYFIDDKLNVSGRVYLRQVYANRIILETNGKTEQLTLEQKEMAITPSKTSTKLKQSDAKSVTERNVQDKRKNQRLSRKLKSYKDKMLSDPKSVADVISGRPHFINGELKGFRISAGKDRRLFQELGLQQNDLVTAINGVALTNMQDAMTLMNDAQSMTELNVEIQRGDEQLNLLLNLNENEKAGLQ